MEEFFRMIAAAVGGVALGVALAVQHYTGDTAPLTSFTIGCLLAVVVARIRGR